MDDLTIPTLFDRKQTPLTPMTVAEQREWLATLPPPPPEMVISNDADQQALEEIERREAEERKFKTDERIKKLKERKGQKDQTKGIPEQYLRWDCRKRRFCDVRVKPARKLVELMPGMTMDAAMERCAEIMKVPYPQFSRWED